MGALTLVLLYGLAAAVTAEGISNSTQLGGGNTCSVKCVPGKGSVKSSNSWVLRLDSNIYLAHSASHNYLAVYNVNLGIAVVCLGNVLLITNVKTGDSLLTNSKIVKLIKGSGVISKFSRETDVYDGFEWLFSEIIIEHKAEVVEETNATTGESFSPKILMEYLHNLKGEIDLTSVVNGRTDLAEQLKRAFGYFFQSVSTVLKDDPLARHQPGVISFVGLALNLPAKSENFYVTIYRLFLTIFKRKVTTDTDIAALYATLFSSITTNKLQQLKWFYEVVNNIRILYDSSVSAFIAFRHKYISFEQKNVKIEDQVLTILFTKDTNSENWKINIRNEKVDLMIIYYHKIETLVFINLAYDVIIIRPTQGTLFAIYNGETGIGIAVKKNLDQAKIADHTAGAIADAYKDDYLKLAFSQMKTAIKQEDKETEDFFDFKDFLGSIHKLGVGYELSEKPNIKARIDENFNSLIANFQNIAGYNPVYSQSNIFLSVFKGLQVGNLPSVYVSLIHNTTTKPDSHTFLQIIYDEIDKVSSKEFTSIDKF